MAESRGILRRVLEEVGRAEMERVREQIGSKTLRAALRLIVNESEQRADLFIPHYWAIYYHDGRGSVHPVTARKLVFFDDPRDDPRAPTPERESQVRRLTKDTYRRGLEINKERRARGLRPFMYVVDSVGPSKPRPFFERLSRGSARRNEALIRRTFEQELLRSLTEDGTLKPEKVRATFRLR